MAENIETSYSYVEVVREFVRNRMNGNRATISGWMRDCTTFKRRVSKWNRNATTPAEKRSFETAIGYLDGYRVLMKNVHDNLGRAEAVPIVGGELAVNLPHAGAAAANADLAAIPAIARNLLTWKEVKSAFVGRMRTECIINISYTDPKRFLDGACAVFIKRMKKLLRINRFFKINMIFCGEFLKLTRDGEVRDMKHFNTRNSVVDSDTQLKEWFRREMRTTILQQLEEFQERDSGWALSAIVNLMININYYQPLIAGTYIELPSFIKKRKCCVNVKNRDSLCAAWAIVSALHPREVHSDRVTSYPDVRTVLNLDRVNFPATLKDIALMETLNDLSINVYMVEGKKIVPVQLSKNVVDRKINLLTISGDNGNSHYVWIKNLSRLVSSQLSAHDGRKFICERCLHYFSSEDKLGKHMELCSEVNESKISFPSGDAAVLRFKNHKNKIPQPYMIYADFEAILRPVLDDPKVVAKHEAHSIGYYLRCTYDDTQSYYRARRGADCASWFVGELKNIAENITEILKNPKPIPTLSPDEDTAHRTATHCYICSKAFRMTGDKIDLKVLDHCHLTGLYRGAAHQTCNLRHQDSRSIPVVFHNMSKYDAHFIIRDICQCMDGDVNIIASNAETYIGFVKRVAKTKLQFKFMDSLRFMAASLGKLGSYLDETPIIASQYPTLDAEKLQLLTRKGVFPYEHIKDWANLDELELPSKEQFYSHLMESGISDSDYEHARSVWREFNISTIGEYSDLYLKVDVLLLADVFENFRTECLRNYALDPGHYYTAPGLSFDSMLLYTDVRIDLIEDVDMLLFFEKAIRGGLTQCSMRHAKANNKYMVNYDISKPSEFIMYYDVNGLYARAMSDYLPYGNLRWTDEFMENVEDIQNIPTNSDVGYLLEVDLDYPLHIHDEQCQLPMAPIKSRPPNSSEEKLLANLDSKLNYVVHYRNLKIYMDSGIVVSRVHRVLKFDQKPWLRGFIDLNARLRRNAKNDFQKNLFKLMSNAVFGKTMENVRQRRDIKLITKWDGRYAAERRISAPNFQSSKIFGENLVTVEMKKVDVLFNKPIFIGVCILDISKLDLYEFHYKYMAVKYPNAHKLCYTDTDSLIYSIQTDDIYADIKNDIHRFDTSDFAPDNIYNMPLVNKKVNGLMKDEFAGKIFTEFIGLRAKMYSCRTADDESALIKAKGVKSAVVQKHISFDDYEQCLYGNEEISHRQHTIRSTNHELATLAQDKISLSPYDNKRYILPGFIETLPWGHYAIMDQEYDDDDDDE